MAPVNASLSIASLINVQAVLQAAATQAANTQSLLALVNTPSIDPVVRKLSFPSASAVASFFGSNTPIAAVATDWFGQSPQPTSMQVGLWAQTATAGVLVGAPLTPTQQLIATWNAITNGGFSIVIDGGSAEVLSSLSFSTAANMNGVAAAIQAHLTGATIAWNAINQNFVVTSATTGSASSVAFATAGSGTDISAMLGLRSTSSGVYEAPGIAAETALAAATLFDANYGQSFYGMTVIGAADTDDVAVAAFLAASSNKHFYWVPTQEAGVLVSATTTDVAYLLSQAKQTKTAVLYSGSNPYAALSLAAKMQTVDYTASNSVIAAMYQTLPGITADNLNPTQLASIIGKNANGFVGYNDGSAIVQPGVCSDGNWIDLVIGADALALAVQAAVWNLLKTQHVSQTDAGMHMINVAIATIMQQFVNNGYIAPGVWYGNLFGSLQNNADGTPPTLTKGYYIYQPPVAGQSQQQKQQRISVPFQIAANLAGAVATASVTIALVN